MAAYLLENLEPERPIDPPGNTECTTNAALKLELISNVSTPTILLLRDGGGGVACPTDLLLSDQTSTGRHTLGATATATLGVNLALNGAEPPLAAAVVDEKTGGESVRAVEMTGRMESAENLGEQRAGWQPQSEVFHPSHRPLEIAYGDSHIPTAPTTIS